MRAWNLTGTALPGFDGLEAGERAAVAAVIAEMVDERVPLVRPDDRSVAHGSSIMGRVVPGTELVLCYIPAGPEFFVVNIRR